MSEQEIPVENIIPLCRQILQELLTGKTPEEVQGNLALQGISAEDAENLINISVASAQTVSPILEEGGQPEQAIEALNKQQMDISLAQPMVEMIVGLMDGNTEQATGAEAAAPTGTEQTIDEEHLKAIIRLGIAVDSDLSQEVDAENIAAAISKISDIGQYPEVSDNVAEFIANVQLARTACTKSLQTGDLHKTMAEMDLHKLPPYVAMLAVFFNKAAASA